MADKLNEIGKLNVVTIQDLWKTNVDGSFPVLVEIYNPDIYWGKVTDTSKNETDYEQENGYLRITSSDVKLIYGGHTFFPCAMQFSSPEVDGTKIGSANITISAIDSRVKMILRVLQIPSVFRIVSTFLKTEKEDGGYIYKFVKLNVRDFNMESASSNESTVTFTLTFNSALQQNIPYDTATADRVPAASSND